jgi:hypothetical protein
LTKYLSTEFRRRILLAEVKPNKKNASVLEKYGITKLSALVVVPASSGDGEEQAPIHYQGDGFTRNKLHSFLAKHALKDPVLNPKKEGTGKHKVADGDTKARKTKDEVGAEKQKVHSEL